jgi:hypothetical protein
MESILAASALNGVIAIRVVSSKDTGQSYCCLPKPLVGDLAMSRPGLAFRSHSTATANMSGIAPCEAPPPASSIPLHLRDHSAIDKPFKRSYHAYGNMALPDLRKSGRSILRDPSSKHYRSLTMAESDFREIPIDARAPEMMV